MDGRACRRIGLLVLMALGCQHQVVTVSDTTALAGPQSQQALKDAVLNKVAAAPPKELPAPVLVSVGDFKTGESLAANVPPQQRQYIREVARQDYEKAIKLDPKCVPAYQGLARLYLLSQDPLRAVEAYQKALQIAPQNAALWYDLGTCHNSQKNWGPAVDCLARAVQLDPGNRTYSNTLAVVLAQAGRYDDSLAYFIRSSGEALGYYRMAQTLDRLQQPQLSQRYRAVALQKDPNLFNSVQQASYPNH